MVLRAYPEQILQKPETKVQERVIIKEPYPIKVNLDELKWDLLFFCVGMLIGITIGYLLSRK